MAKQLQLRRGTTTEHGSFTGAAGEVTVDTDKDTVVVHDNSTAGGIPLLRADVNNLADDAVSLDKVNGGTLGTGTIGGSSVVNTSGSITSTSATGILNTVGGTSARLISYSGNAGAVGTSTNHKFVVQTNASDRMTIDTSGNVGIGTNAPDSTADTNLHVKGATTAALNIEDDEKRWNFYVNGYMNIRENTTSRIFIAEDTGKVGINTTAPDTLLSVRNNTNAAGYSAVFRGGTNALTTANDYNLIGFGYAGADSGFINAAIGNIYTATSGAGDLIFCLKQGGEANVTNSDEKMRITASGNVGIGETSPDNTLHLGSLGGDDGIFLDGTTKVKITTTTDGGTDSLYVTGQQDRAFAQYWGPKAQSGGANCTLQLGDNDTGGSEHLNIVKTAGSYAYITPDSNRDLILQSSGTGKVGIGTTSPDALLDVESTTADAKIRVHTTGASDDSYLEVIADGASGDSFVHIDTPRDGALKFFDTSSQKWAFLMHSTDSYKMKIVDHDFAQGVELAQDDSNGWGVVSDIRWKTNWEEYEGALENLKTLKAGKYNFKNLETDKVSETYNSGLLAQEVEKFLPFAVSTSMQGATDEKAGIERKTLKYQALIPYLVKAIQELSAKVTTLENA
jgi:hypothetical protein